MSKKQLLVAHRGLSGWAPENTQLSFDAAATFQADGIELDVHLSADQQLIVCHDEKVDRTSNIKGYIKDLTLAELKTGNFAFSHELKLIKPQTVMTLEEVFKRYLSRFKVINIELKTDVFHYANIEDKVADLINKYQAHKQVMISSFYFPSLQKMHQLLPNVEQGFLFESWEQWNRVDLNAVKKNCQYLNPDFQLYDQDPTKLEALGLLFNFWTVRNRTVHEKLLKNPHCFSQISNFIF